MDFFGIALHLFSLPFPLFVPNPGFCLKTLIPRKPSVHNRGGGRTSSWRSHSQPASCSTWSTTTWPIPTSPWSTWTTISWTASTRLPCPGLPSPRSTYPGLSARLPTRSYARLSSPARCGSTSAAMAAAWSSWSGCLPKLPTAARPGSSWLS